MSRISASHAVAAARRSIRDVGHRAHLTIENGRASGSPPSGTIVDRRRRRAVGTRSQRVAQRLNATPARRRPRPRPRRPADCEPTPPGRARAPSHARTSETRRPALDRARRREFASLSPFVRRPSRDDRRAERNAPARLPASRSRPPFRSRDDERLLLAVADRNEQPSALGELVEQRLRHRRRAGADEDRVVRRVLAPTDGSVAEQQARRCCTPARWMFSRACCISAGIRSIEKTCATRCASSTV